MSDYPKQWKDLAKSIKEKANWRCDKCGRICLRPGDKSITDKPRAYNLQVHHWDRNPSNNRVENLISLCSACHLSYHRGGRGNISPGQLGCRTRYVQNGTRCKVMLRQMLKTEL